MKINVPKSAAAFAASLASASFVMPVAAIAQSACVEAEETACPVPPEEPKHIDADAPEQALQTSATVTRPVRGGYFRPGFFAPNYFARGYFAEPR